MVCRYGVGVVCRYGGVGVVCRYGAGLIWCQGMVLEGCGVRA